MYTDPKGLYQEHRQTLWLSNPANARQFALRIFFMVYVALATALIGLMLLSFAVGAFTVYGTGLGAASISREVGRIPFFVVGIPIVFPVSVTVGELFAIIWSIYLLLLVVALSGPSKNFLSAISDLLHLTPNGTKWNSAFNVARMFSILVVLITLIDFFQERAGIPTGSLPEADPIVKFVILSYAPLVEEIGFRVTIIGLTAIVLLKGRQLGSKAVYVLWSPAKYLKLFLKEEYKSAFRYVLVAVAVSAVFFGAAHVLYGAGWKLGKVTTSTLAGLGLGWLYLEYGFAAAVLLHWSFNYFGSSFFYFSKATGGSPIDPIIDFLLFALGTISLVNYGISQYTRTASPSN